MSVKLKIKAKSLAEEARIIRKEEKNQKASASWQRMRQEFAAARGSEETLTSLYLHRTQEVRPEARATHLARAFLKGRESVEVEGASTRTGPNLDRVLQMVNKYRDKTEAPYDIIDLTNWYNLT